MSASLAKFKCKCCGVVKTIPMSRIRVGEDKFCSRKCSNKYHPRFGTKNPNWNGGGEKECPVCLSLFWVKPSASSRRLCCSTKCRNEFWKRIGKYAGENNPSWKGGITVITRGIRASLLYRHWRDAVKNRDGMCVKCGSKKQLHADHIKPFSLFPQLRFELSNGQTLCWECHKKTPTYGGSSKLSANLIESFA